ncbi:MAG: hypothetical protein WKF78_15295 [Candidatus Limnocylindrales bacterium]
MTSAILSRIVRRAARACSRPAADDRLADALDLDVHLQGGHTVPRTGHLEVHVADRVLLAEDVGQDHERAVRLADQAHRGTGDGCLDRHTGIHEREGGPAGRGHRGGPVGGHALAHEADHVGELFVAREDRDEGPLGQVAVADVAPAGPAHHLVLAGAVGREVVMVEVALLGLRADRVDALDVRGRAERGDGQRLGLAAGEQP